MVYYELSMNALSSTAKKIDVVFNELSTAAVGLSEDEASARLQKFGSNQISGERIHWWQILYRQFNTPFIFLLIAAMALSLAMKEFINSIMILCFVVVNAVLGFVQEYHSERSLEFLKKYVVASARVRRAGQEVSIPCKDLVPGDIVIIEAGDIIPADLRLFVANDLAIDESILTGESAPVEKTADAFSKAASAYHEAANCAFTSTTVMSGKGVGVAIATGRVTALGDISRLTMETYHESSFQKGIAKFSKFILRMILVILVVLFGVNIFIKGGNANIFELLLFSVALAVSVVPEALPVVTTIALSRGAALMARHKVVVKRLSAVEDLGSIEVLCVDKTGTLTENHLTVRDVFGADRAKVLFSAALASSFLGEKKREPNNAFDLALWDALPAGERKTLSRYSKISDIPFDPVRRRNSVLIKTGSVCRLIVRGAPEVVARLCLNLPLSEKKKIDQWILNEGKVGNRVIAVAERSLSGRECHSVGDEGGLSFVGLISFVDPVKATAPSALAEAKKLGVQVKILTGDSREVAAAVAASVGLVRGNHEVITGEELDALATRAERQAAAEKMIVFARVSPRQKYEIIELLQNKFEVGFLGEGINDAPALKMANVGIVVDGASDIAREAADIVLLKRSLSVIIDGIREGREIFANTVKYIKATLISNFGNFFAIAVASLLIPYLPMLPAQILLLNLLSDFPMIAIAADTVDRDELRRPRSYNVREVVIISLILGAVSTVFDFIFFAVFNRQEPAILQTGWFIGSVLTELLLIFSIRTHFFFARAKPPRFILATLSVVACLAAIGIPYSAFGQNIFGFIPPNGRSLLLVLVIASSYFIVTETIKVLFYQSASHLKAVNHQAAILPNGLIN